MLKGKQCHRSSNLLCGPSMKDCPETSGNHPWRFSGRFPAGFRKNRQNQWHFQLSCKTCHSNICRYQTQYCITTEFGIFFYGTDVRSGITSDFGFLLETSVASCFLIFFKENENKICLNELKYFGFSHLLKLSVVYLIGK